jgi:hypothetical protein
MVRVYLDFVKEYLSVENILSEAVILKGLKVQLLDRVVVK